MKPSEDSSQKNLLNQFFNAFNVEFSKETIEKLYGFADLVVETKEYGNLISPKDSEKILSRHIADSLIPYIFIGKKICDSVQDSHPAIRWADMGAGAGCPVFPLAIVMPQIQFYAVEPRNKRVQFMQYVKETLHLSNMTVVGKRFETSGLYDLDFISCRALSTFENDWDRAEPSLKVSGTFLTLKSYNSIVQLENDPNVNIDTYSLINEEQVYALVTRGKK